MNRSDQPKKNRRRRFVLSALTSVILHLLGVSIYQSLMPAPPLPTTVLRFPSQRSTPTERFRGDAAPDALRAQMERLTINGQPAAVPEIAAGPIVSLDLMPDTQPLRERETGGEKELQPTFPDREEEAITLGEIGPIAKGEEFAMDLMDLPTLALSGRFKAAIIIDEKGLRHPEGFINFTYLLLDGTTAIYGLESLARYMRDYTSIMAYARGVAVRGFSTDTLLEAPILFFFPGPLRGRASSQDRIFLDEDESERLGRYLRGGGFLLVDAGDSPDDHWFRKEALRQIRLALKSQGEVVELPLDHPIYSAYYEFSNGFPGERKNNVMRFARTLGDPWHYPSRMPCTGQLRGLWGVEWEGTLVAVLSDLSLQQNWSGQASDADLPSCPQGTQVAVGGGGIPYLRAATNIVTYALTRPGSRVTQLAPFAWRRLAPAKPHPDRTRHP